MILFHSKEAYEEHRDKCGSILEEIYMFPISKTRNMYVCSDIYTNKEELTMHVISKTITRDRVKDYAIQRNLVSVQDRLKFANSVWNDKIWLIKRCGIESSAFIESYALYVRLEDKYTEEVLPNTEFGEVRIETNGELIQGSYKFNL